MVKIPLSEKEKSLVELALQGRVEALRADLKLMPPNTPIQAAFLQEIREAETLLERFEKY